MTWIHSGNLSGGSRGLGVMLCRTVIWRRRPSRFCSPAFHPLQAQRVTSFFPVSLLAVSRGSQCAGAPALRWTSRSNGQATSAERRQRGNKRSGSHAEPFLLIPSQSLPASARPNLGPEPISSIQSNKRGSQTAAAWTTGCTDQKRNLKHHS